MKPNLIGEPKMKKTLLATMAMCAALALAAMPAVAQPTDAPPGKVLTATASPTAEVLTLKASTTLAPVPEQRAAYVLFSGFDGLLGPACSAKKDKGGKGGGGKKCVTASTGPNASTMPGMRLLT